MAELPIDVFLVSDLHLGPGPQSCVETFFKDEAFANFVAVVSDRPAETAGECRLVILGDFVDFLRTQLVTNPGDELAAEAVAVEAFEQIVAGHPRVFGALGQLLARGVQLDVVLGNHDAELIRPGIQQCLRAVLAEAGAGHAADEVRFLPWIYYVPGLLYAEHGHQHDDLNAFSAVLDPFDPYHPDVLERSVGTEFFMASERLMASIDPCPDHASPPARYFKLAARREPRAASRIVAQEIDLLRNVARHAQALSGPHRETNRAAYREKVLGDYSPEIGLTAQTVREIDEMSAASKRPTQALMKQALSRTAKKLLPARPTPTGSSPKYLHKAAQRIRELLDHEEQAASFYVFGHSHVAQHLPLEFGPGAAQYLNTGTWSSIVNPASDTLRTVRPTFVHVSRPADGAPPVARLLAWNAASGSAETLRFQT